MPKRDPLPPESRYVVRANGCWEWLGCTDPNGYGRLYHPDKKRSYLAHRFFYERVHGEAPDTLDHKCQNPRCVNPEHLRPMGRGENAALGKAKLTREAVAYIRRSGKSRQALADRFGVATCTISNVRAGRGWKGV